MIKLINTQIIILIITSFIILLTYSINFNNNKIHPLIIISILIILLILASLNLRLYFNNHWFSFLIFIIIVGGIIVIFLYFISFINNIKTSIKWFFLKFIPLKILSIITLFFITYNLINNLNWIINFNEIITFYKNINFNILNLTYIFIYPKNFTTLLCILYLLLALTIIVKICLIKKLTLRKFNYEKIYF